MAGERKAWGTKKQEMAAKFAAGVRQEKLALCVKLRS